MAIAILEATRNMKIKYKIVLLLGIFFLLIANLGLVNISSVRDIQDDTAAISENVIPRLLTTTAVKDNINLAILSAYDYTRSGDLEDKQQYERHLNDAVAAQIELFQLSSSEADFEFTSSFEQSINDINSSLEDLIITYESGASSEELDEKLAIVAGHRDTFAEFLTTEIESAAQAQANAEREKTAARVQQTILIVSIIAVVTLLVVFVIYYFANRNVSKPIEELIAVAQSITDGKFKAAIIDNQDELGVFAETFNTMIQKLSAVQESLKIELEKTQALDQQKSQFVATAAHELRTPISGLKWMLDMAVAGDLGAVDDDAKEQLAKGVENVNRMTMVINQLLAVAEIETGEVQYNMMPMPVSDLFTALQEQFAPAAEEGGVTLTLENSNDLQMTADKDKMTTAIAHLVDNAIRYTEKDGSVTVSASGDGSEVTLTIKDTGLGIPEEEQHRVFQKLFRGSNTEAVNNLGTGLGLFITQEIVSAHGGDITFTSKQNEGTTFTVTLPVESE